jgi:DNA polymerase I
LKRRIYLIDFEFIAKDGEQPDVVCMVAKEVRTGEVTRMWGDELYSLHNSPFDTGPDSLFVAFFVSAELGCFLSLGWKLPERILDL